jgi:hypothetical protein
MTRGGFLFGALVVLGALLWLVVVWPMPRGAEPPAAAWGSAGADAPAPALPDPPRSPPPAAVSVKADAPAPAEAPAAEPKKATVPAQPPTPLLFSEPHGPVDEYKQRYASEPRDSAAHEAEGTVSAAFKPTDTTSQLLRSVLCRETICRMELNFSDAEIGPYVAAMTRLTLDFDREFAINPMPNPSGVQPRPVEVYLKRNPAPRGSN